jgi:Xaa-Pro aminopeptidase
MSIQIDQRIKNIRQWLLTNELDALIVPHEDEYLGEYLPKHNERLHWLTGFTGSAGVAIVTQNNAAIFVDGRYTVQVTKQVSDQLFEYHHLIDEPFLEWLVTQLPRNSRVGFDPKMHRGKWINSAQQQLQGVLTLTPVTVNPIDQLWLDRPTPQRSDMILLPDSSVGISSHIKRLDIGLNIDQADADCAIITALDSICWLLNIRGLDVARLPVILCHAILYKNGHMDLFLDENRLAPNFHAHVGEGVTLYQPKLLEFHLNQLKGKRVLLDPDTSNGWFNLILERSAIVVIKRADPCLLPKAQKNAHEQAGMKNCHIRDGLAMTKFLHWLDGQIAQHQPLDEAIIADKLELYRRQDPTLVDLSFDTISAAGSNAAMCHYNHMNQPTPGVLSYDSLYLVDSGGQYLDGTTDITRTIAIGTPTPEMVHQFTLVLKGHIALATARFPKGTCGHQLDILARQYLWQEGFDYDHGTGHGVGHFLSVHEGPQRISKAVNETALMPGMVLSNEPGYYRADAFGIRIENLELVTECDTRGDKLMLQFSSLTRCPIDKRAIDLSLLTAAEIDWLDNYHQKVWLDVSPLVGDIEVLDWLKQATAPLIH